MAAAISGVFPVCLDQQQTQVEDEEKKKKQILMERLRNKRYPHRSWTDSVMKSIRSNLDKKGQPDPSERHQVQKCLDTLQRAMKVLSQQSLVERLRLIARQQGLESHVIGSDQPIVKIEGEMFLIEILLNKGGGVKEVKIKHQGDSSNASQELKEILTRGDFAEFTSHLEGLQSIYRVTGERKLKSKAFQALHSLECDLNGIAQLQNSSINGVTNYIHKTPLGILVPRTAGKPMKLIYFVSPYDLLDKRKKTAHPMTLEAITEHGLGRSATVCLEPGPEARLQTMTLVSYTKQPGGGCLPSFNGINTANSTELPARFVLVLSQPIPVAMSVIHKIKAITDINPVSDKSTQPLLNLILDSNSDGKIKKDESLFVSLPDQDHRYYINGVGGGILDEPGVMLSRIPFIHPTYVPKILNLLRQQLIFNSILASCVRPCARKNPPTCLVFEMTVVSLNQLSITFEHPAHDAMVTVDIDLSEITNLKCRLLEMGASNSNFQALCSDEFACKVLQRSLSLPILFRALIRSGRVHLEKRLIEAKEAEEQARKAHEAAVLAAHFKQQQLIQQQQQARLAALAAKSRQQSQSGPHSTPTYPPLSSPLTSSNPPSVGGIGDLRGMTGSTDMMNSSPPGYHEVMDSKPSNHNPLLVNLLDSERLRPHSASPGVGGCMQQSAQTQSNLGESSMLSRLLDDNISVATNITPINNPSMSVAPPPPIQHPPPHQAPKSKVMKGRKRRSQSDMIMTGRSPKHRIGDGDGSERSYGSLDLDSSSSPFESSLGGSGGMPGFHHQMGPSPVRPPSQGHMSGIIDLTEENMPESSLKKLEDFSNREGFVPNDHMRPGGATPDLELQAFLGRATDHRNSSSPNMAGLKPNQMTGPKNENASTSPEGHLIGSGEVGKASLPDPATAHLFHMGQQQQLHHHQARFATPTSLAAFLGHGQATAKSHSQDLNSGSGGLLPPDKALPKDIKPNMEALRGKAYLGNYMEFIHNRSEEPMMPVPNRGRLVSSSSMTDMPDVKPQIGKKGAVLKHSTSTATTMPSPAGDARSLFEKFDCSGMNMPQIVHNSSSSGNGGDGDDLAAPKVRIKMPHFRVSHSKSIESASVVQSPSSAGSKSSNSNTMFDFRSDEEDDDQPFAHISPVVNAERLTVYASSPTRLQISSKAKPPTPVDPSPESIASMVMAKPEKYKRSKEKGSSKRKRDRDESKREKKRKRAEHDRYLPTGKETVYRASTIEGDQKSGTKLKIRVSKEPFIQTPPPQTLPVKGSSLGLGRMDVNPLKAEKFCEKVNDALMKRRSVGSTGSVSSPSVLSKHDMKDLQSDEGSRDSTDYPTQMYKSSSSSKSKSGGFGKVTLGTTSNSALSKSDPKLAKATIRLKPLSLTSATTSASAITITSSSKAMPSNPISTSSNSADRSDRRSQSSSVSTPVSTPTTTGPLCISTYLPDAPTPKSVASLPKIPRVSSSVSSTAVISSGTTTTNATGLRVGVGANNSGGGVKNSAMNSSFNNAVKSGNPSMGPGGNRPGSSLNVPNTTKSNASGFNRAGGQGAGIAMQKTSSPKTFGNSSMPPGILKNSGNVSGTNAQKLAASGNQMISKGPGSGPNQAPNSHNRTQNLSGQPGVPQKSTQGSQQGIGKNTPNANTGPYKGASPQGSVPRTMSGSGVQRSPNLNQGGGVQRTLNQGGSTKVSGSPNQNVGPQKTNLQGKAGGGGSGSNSAAGNQPKNFSQGGVQSHKTTSQVSSGSSSNFPAKSQGSGGWSSPSHGQKGQQGNVAGGGGRTVPSGGYGSSPNSGNNNGRTANSTNNARSNSVAGSGGNNGGRTVPNHLPINRSIPAPGHKPGSSSPRVSGQSPSNPSAPKFPSNSQQPKNSGVSPSSVSQRPNNSSQASSQRCNSTGTPNQNSGQRSTSNPSQHASPIPQAQRPSSTSNAGSGSGQNQRPSSTPGISVDPRSGGQSPSHPVRPSSAGPRQNTNSPSGPRQATSASSGQGSASSSPTSGRTSSPNSSGNRQGQKSSGSTGTVVSPLVSRPSSVSSNTNSISTLNRQNSSGSLNPHAAAKNVGHGGDTSVTSAAASSKTTVSSSGLSSSSHPTSTSSSGSTVSSSSQSSAVKSTTSSPAIPRKSSTESVTSVSKQNPVSTTNISSSRQPSVTTAAGTGTSVTSATVTKPSPAASTAASKPQSSGSSSTATTTAPRTSVPNAVPRTSTSNSASVKTSTSTTIKTPVNKTTLSAAGAAAKLANNTGSVSVTKSIAGSGKPATTATALVAGIKTTAGSGENKVSGVATSAAPKVTANAGTTKSSVAPVSGKTLSTVSTSKPAPSVASSSPPASSSLATTAVTGNKAVMSAAARGRKNSLNAILDKLSNRAAGSSTTDSGDSTGNGTPASLVTVSKVNEAASKDGKKSEQGEVRTGVKRSASLSGISPSAPEAKMPRLEAHKPALPNITMPSSTIPSPAHSTPPHTSPSFAATGPFSVERRWSVEKESVGEVGLDLSKRETGLDLSMPKDLSVPKEKTRSESSNPLHPPRPDSRDRVSPKDANVARSGSPSVGGEGKVVGGTKFNGDSSKDKTRAEVDLFKVPTPKTHSGEEGDSSSGRLSTSPVRNIATPSRPLSNPAPASPQSDASSPGNDLVIDCGDIGSSRHTATALRSITPTPSVLPSPKRVGELAVEGGSGRASPNVSVSKTSPTNSVCKNLPQVSPHSKLTSPTGQVASSPIPNDAGITSPYMLDDDLMDMALTG